MLSYIRKSIKENTTSAQTIIIAIEIEKLPVGVCEGLAVGRTVVGVVEGFAEKQERTRITLN
jgi:hypothetical protein